MLPNRAEIRPFLNKKFLFQLFSIGAIFLFLLSAIFQPSFWNIKTANAVSDGLGISLDDNPSYNTTLSANIINTGITPAGLQTLDMGVFHCNTAGSGVCSGNDTPDDIASDSRGVSSVTIDIPGPGGTRTRTFSDLPNYTCGRVQVDFGWPGHSENGGIVGGRVFNLGSNCAGPAPTKTATLTASCPNNTPTLSANWNVGSGSSCNIYIQADQTPNKISSDCSGNNSSITSLSPSGAVVNGGTYRLFASDGTTTTQSELATVNCAAPPPPPAGQCTYGSTQARWQVNASDPWGSSKTINLGQSANAGSFHDATGQFASDTTLTITGPGTNTTRTNGQSFAPSQAGTYTLTVTTNGQSGAACTDTATLTVNQVAPTCTWDSTQARVQRDLNDPWASSKTINLGDQIRVGGFHNSTGLFADSGTVSLNVTGPESFSSLSNGQFITPSQAGTFNLRVTTPNQSGANCEDTASFVVQPVVTPTPTATPIPTVTPIPTATPQGSQNVTVQCPNGSTVTVAAGQNANFNSLCQNQQQSQTQNSNQVVNVTATGGSSSATGGSSSSSSSSTSTGGSVGNVGVGGSGQVLGITQLPKTGLPQLAWSALAFIPAGFGLRRFRNLKKTLADDPNYIWEERKFKAS